MTLGLYMMAGTVYAAVLFFRAQAEGNEAAWQYLLEFPAWAIITAFLIVILTWPIILSADIFSQVAKAIRK